MSDAAFRFLHLFVHMQADRDTYVCQLTFSYRFIDVTPLFRPGKHFDESRSPVFQQSLAGMHLVQTGAKALAVLMTKRPGRHNEADIRECFNIISSGVLHSDRPFAITSPWRATTTRGPNRGKPVYLMDTLLDALDLFDVSDKSMCTDSQTLSRTNAIIHLSQERGNSKKHPFKFDNDFSTWQAVHLHSSLLMLSKQPTAALALLSQCTEQMKVQSVRAKKIEKRSARL